MPISDLSLSFILHIVIFLPPFMTSNPPLYLGHFMYCRSLNTVKASFQWAVPLARHRRRATCVSMPTCPVETNHATPAETELLLMPPCFRKMRWGHRPLRGPLCCKGLRELGAASSCLKYRRSRQSFFLF